MTNVLFTGRFDNGHDFYNIDAEVSLDTSKARLSNQDIVNIVQELERSDRRRHGRSYRGKVVAFTVSTEEFELAEDKGLIKYQDVEEVYRSEDLHWLDWFAEGQDILSAFEVVEAEEGILEIIADLSLEPDMLDIWLNESGDVRIQERGLVPADQKELGLQYVGYVDDGIVWFEPDKETKLQKMVSDEEISL